MAKNKPNMIPWFPGNKNHQIRTSDFLQGRKKVYFTAGQAPDGMSNTLAGYRRPMAFNTPTSLLRVPQMVWLSEAFIDCHAETYSVNQGTGVYNGACFRCITPTESFTITDLRDNGSGTLTDTVSGYTAIYGWGDGHIETETYQGWTANFANIPDPSGDYSYSVSPASSPYVVSGTYTFYSPQQYPAGTINLASYGSPPDPDARIATVTNSNRQEYIRVNSIFSNVKRRIEALRPERTWVDIIDYCGCPTCEYDPDTNTISGNPRWPNDRFINGGIGLTDTMDNTQMYGFAVAPPETEQYFGTNFLNIWVGGVNSDSLNNPINNQGYFPTGAPDISRDSSYAYSKVRVIAAYPKFAGYNVYLYAPDTRSQDTFSLPSLITLPNCPCGPDGELPIYRQIDSINNFNTQRTINMNNTLSNQYPALVGYYQNIAADLAAYGFHYGGDSSHITEDNLVRLIARNFGFDPVTGKDL